MSDFQTFHSHAADLLSTCTLCPRECRVNRMAGQTGICGETAILRGARAALHFWEEPCISGKSGSGAVFFSGCSVGCVFCQNQSIAHGETGFFITSKRLSEIFLELQEQNANNINLVTPTHFIPQIREALLLARDAGLSIPIVYNTSGYEKVESLHLLHGLVDIYMPDCKYVSSELSTRYSHCSDYFAQASRAIVEMVHQVGTPLFSGDPEEDSYSDEVLMKRGVLVRHLLLPGCVEDSKQVLSWLHETFGEQIYISIMRQYTPLPQVAAFPELNRTVTDDEYEELVDYAISIGIEQAFIQEDGVNRDSFIPAFDGKGILPQ